MVAVKVTGDVEMGRGEEIIDNGGTFTVENGHLFVWDARAEELLASYAPGKWLAAKKDARFT
jgi:hypothetical protein